MTAVIAIAASAALLVPSVGAATLYDPCSSVATVSPNFVPDWCGKRAPNGYEAFRKAFTEYRAAIADVVSTTAGVMSDLNNSCLIDGSGINLAKPADPAEIDLIVARLGISRQAVDRAGKAWNAMKTAQKQAFADDPQAPAVSVDIDALQKVIEGYGRVIPLIEGTGDLYSVCNSLETLGVAQDGLQTHQIEFVNNGTENIRITADIQMAFQATQDACKKVRVREKIPKSQMKQLTTRQVGGAALTYPKSVKVGKKAVQLPVSVTSATSGYGTVAVTRGSKGIVATGGWMEPGTFGLLMTVPGKTKAGKLTVTFTADGGPTVQGRIRLT